jgi:hypothetical protein
MKVVKGLFGWCLGPPHQIKGTPIFWRGIRFAAYRQRMGVKTEGATKILD